MASLEISISTGAFTTTFEAARQQPDCSQTAYTALVYWW